MIFKSHRCFLCSSPYTRSDATGKYIWITHKSKYSERENIDAYICYDCAYVRNRYCCKCGGDIKLLKVYDENGYWDGRRVCNSCFQKSKRRYVEIDKEEAGYITEVLVARCLGLQTNVEKNGCFSYDKYDLYDNEYGYIDVKSSRLRKLDDLDGYGWMFFVKKNIFPDFYFCIGYDRYLKHVKVVYIIPNEHFISSQDILYIKENDVEFSMYKEDEKPWDDLFHELGLDYYRKAKRLVF